MTCNDCADFLKKIRKGFRNDKFAGYIVTDFYFYMLERSHDYVRGDQPCTRLVLEHMLSNVQFLQCSSWMSSSVDLDKLRKAHVRCISASVNKAAISSPS